MGYTLGVVALGSIMLAVERVWPGRKFERVSGWHTRATTLSIVQVAIVCGSTYAWGHWFRGFQLWRLGGHGLLIDATLAYLAITFVDYWWHRARHEIPILWRLLHQVHHSACSIEILTTFYKHPVEQFINGMLSSALLCLLLGFDAPSASLAMFLAGAAELFYHWNVRTPHWLGYLIQRPESHCIHHLRGWHRNNYSDLPLWDMLFGTFENPRTQPSPCGFSTGAEERLASILLGEDVSAGPEQPLRNAPAGGRA